MRTSENLSINKGFASTLVVILLISLAVLGTIEYLQFKPKPLALIQTAAQSSTPDPTANWKTYNNEVLGLVLKYPSDLKEEKSNKDPGFLRLSSDHFYMIFIISNTSSTTVEEYLRYSFSRGIPTAKYHNYETIMQTATKKTINGQEFIISPAGAEIEKSQRTAWSVHNGKLYQIKTPKYGVERLTSEQIKEFDQILSTFKFTTNPTENWSTYKNTNYFFMYMKYPNDLEYKEIPESKTVIFSPVGTNDKIPLRDIRIKIYDNARNLSLEEFSKNYFGANAVTEPFMLADRIGVEVKNATGQNIKIIRLLAVNYWDKIYTISFNERLTPISNSDQTIQDDVFDKMLSTFIQ